MYGKKSLDDCDCGDTSTMEVECKSDLKFEHDEGKYIIGGEML